MTKYWTLLFRTTGNAIIHAILLVARTGLTWVKRKGEIVMSASPHLNVALPLTRMALS
jgi:hypothetical protein